MARLYISFLGTTEYVPCTYVYNDKEIRNVRFVQEATLRLFCNTWTQEDRAVIFTTRAAYEKNWKDKSRGSEGLDTCIKKSGLQVPVYNRYIPEGKNREEIWEIFDEVYNIIHKGDRVVFDITHAFRSIPMLAIVILNYAKVVKDVSLEGIYYGAFEVLGGIKEAINIPLEKRKAPILELTSLDMIMEWSLAIDHFLKSGNASHVKLLTKRSVDPVLAKTKGKDQAAKTIRDLGLCLDEFSKVLSTCRGKKITEAANSLKHAIEECRNLELIKPFRPVFDLVREQMKQFSGSDTVKDGVMAAKWCLAHNLIQQAYTILQETLITHIAHICGLDPNEVYDRNIASSAVTISLKRLSEKEWRNEAKKSPEKTRKAIEVMKGNKELLNIYRDLSNDRNDINHAGNMKNPMKADKFSSKLEKFIKQIDSLVG